MSNNRIVPCPECSAASGEICRYVSERRRGEPLPVGHPIRHDAYRHYRAAEETANAIADWLEQRGDSCNPVHSAQLIREGKWRP